MPFDELLPDGVYLNLSPEAYFGQERRGSSDWIKVHQLKHGWWWQSAYNPDRKDKRTKELIYGTALHSIMLEGPIAYARAFAAAPDPAAIEGLVETVPQMRAALAEAGFEIAGSSKFLKPDWLREMHAKLPDVPVWENIMQDFTARIGERTVVSALEDRMLHLMREIAIDPDYPGNESIRNRLTPRAGCPALPEVSILGTMDDMPRRWRIDRMFPGVDLDLKSLGKWRGRPLKYETGEVLARNGWDIQRADYFNGRTLAYELIREGKLFGGSVEQRRYIQKIVEEEPTWDWMWLIYQKPEPTGRAPVIFPLWDNSFGPRDSDGKRAASPIRAYGQNKLSKAVRFYKECVARFGLDKPWAYIEELHYTDAELQPHVSLPHWIADEDPEASEAWPSMPDSDDFDRSART